MTTIRALEAENRALQAENRMLADDFAGAEHDLGQAEDRIDDLVSTLCWYADPANYKGAFGIDNDAGNRARRALGRCASAEATEGFGDG